MRGLLMLAALVGCKDQQAHGAGESAGRVERLGDEVERIQSRLEKLEAEQRAFREGTTKSVQRAYDILGSAGIADLANGQIAPVTRWWCTAKGCDRTTDECRRTREGAERCKPQRVAWCSSRCFRDEGMCTLMERGKTGCVGVE